MGKDRGLRNFRVDLRAVVYSEGEWWIAHCLELDLVAEGKTPDQALRDLMELSETQIETAIKAGNLESVFRSAPPQIWAMFSTANDTAVRKRSARPPVERFDAREAVLV